MGGRGRDLTLRGDSITALTWAFTERTRGPTEEGWEGRTREEGESQEGVIEEKGGGGVGVLEQVMAYLILNGLPRCR